MKVEILSYASGKKKVIATIESVGGEIKIDTKHSRLKDELKSGIVGRGGKSFTFADGDMFIKELPYAYSGSMVRAKIV